MLSCYSSTFPGELQLLSVLSNHGTIFRQFISSNNIKLANVFLVSARSECLPCCLPSKCPSLRPNICPCSSLYSSLSSSPHHFTPHSPDCRHTHRQSPLSGLLFYIIPCARGKSTESTGLMDGDRSFTMWKFILKAYFVK